MAELILAGGIRKRKKRRVTYTIYIHIYHKTKVQKIYRILLCNKEKLFTLDCLCVILQQWGGALRDETNNGCVGDYLYVCFVNWKKL